MIKITIIFYIFDKNNYIHESKTVIILTYTWHFQIAYRYLHYTYIATSYSGTFLMLFQGKALHHYATELCGSQSLNTVINSHPHPKISCKPFQLTWAFCKLLYSTIFNYSKGNWLLVLQPKYDKLYFPIMKVPVPYSRR